MSHFFRQTGTAGKAPKASVLGRVCGPGPGTPATRRGGGRQCPAPPSEAQVTGVGDGAVQQPEHRAGALPACAARAGAAHHHGTLDGSRVFPTSGGSRMSLTDRQVLSASSAAFPMLLYGTSTPGRGGEGTAAQLPWKETPSCLRAPAWRAVPSPAERARAGAHVPPLGSGRPLSRGPPSTARSQPRQGHSASGPCARFSQGRPRAGRAARRPTSHRAPEPQAPPPPSAASGGNFRAAAAPS